MKFSISESDRMELIVSLTMSVLRVDNCIENCGPDSMFYHFYNEQKDRLVDLLHRLQYLPYEDLFRRAKEVCEDEKLPRS